MADGYLNFNTKIDTTGFNKGTNTVSKSIEMLKSSIVKIGAAVGVAFGIKQIASFGKSCVSAATQAQNAMMGLQSIVQGQGKSFSQANKFIQEYTADGLIPLAEATTAYKNLASRGYSTDQIENVMTALKNSAAYGRQASLTMGEAVSSATEGLKNENSILVDNAGVTKNVSVMWKDYAESLGTSYAGLTKQQKIQAEVNGILTETRFQTGDAAKVASSFSGQISQLSTSFLRLKSAVGGILMNALEPVVKGINNMLSSMISYVNTASGSLSKMFGWENKSGGAAAETASSISDSVDNQQELTDAVESTTDAQSKSLAKFDELNTISSNTSNDNEQTYPSTSTANTLSHPLAVTIDADTQKAGNKISALQKMLESFKKPIIFAWKEQGGKVIENARYTFAIIKLLISDIAKSFAGVWGNGTGEKTVENILIYFQDILGIIGDITGALQTAWHYGGTGTLLIQSYFDRWNALLDLIHIFRGDFRDVWNDGAGSELCTNIFNIIININNSVANLRKEFSDAWKENDAGKSILQGIFELINIVLGTVRKLTEATSNWAKNLDFSPLLKSIDGLLKSLEPLTENIGAGLEWFYKNVLLPLAGWTIENIIPEFLELLGAAISLLNSAITVLKPLGKWLWDSFLQQIASWTGGAIISILGAISDALGSISTWVAQNQTAFEAITVVISAFFAAWETANFATFMINIGGIIGIISKLNKVIKAGILLKIKDKAAALELAASYIKDLAISIASTIANLTKEAAAWIASTAAKVASTAATAATSVATAAWTTVCTIATVATTALGAAFTFLTGPIGLIILAIAAVIAIGVLLVKHWDDIKKFCAPAFNAIKGIISKAVESVKGFFVSIISFFKDNWQSILLMILNPFAGAFKLLYDNCDGFRNFWLNLFENVKSIVSSAIDAVKGFFENIINFFTDNWQGILLLIINPFAGAFKLLYDNCDEFRSYIDNLITDVAGFLKNAWDTVTGIFSIVGDWFKVRFSEAWNNITAIFDATKNYFSDRLNDIISVFNVVGDWFKGVFSEAWNNITAIFDEVKGYFTDRWNDMISVFCFAGEWFGNVFLAAWNNITAVFNAVKGYFSGRWNDMISVFCATGSWFGNTFRNAWNEITGIFGGIGGWFADRFQSAYDNITGIFSGLGGFFSGIWDDVGNFFHDGINGLISLVEDGLNFIIDKIDGLDIKNPITGEKIFSMDIDHVKIDRLAKGGVVNSPTIAQIGEAGTEAVVPLENNTGWISKIAKLINLNMEMKSPAATINQNFTYYMNTSDKLRQSDISGYKFSKVPHLATGTVVPANYGEFLAVLGDNQREAEVVSPISTIKQAVADAFSQIKRNKESEVVNVYLYPSASAYQRDVLNAVKNYKARGGKI